MAYVKRILYAIYKEYIMWEFVKRILYAYVKNMLCGNL